MPKCFKCSVSLENLTLFRKHLRRHNVEKNDVVFCVEVECGTRQFSNLSSLTRHYKTFHPVASKQEASRVIDEALPSEEVNLDTNELMDIAEDNQDVLCNDEGEGLVTFLQDEVDLFLSKLYENPKIPRKEVQSVVNYTRSLLQGMGGILKPACLDLVKQANVSQKREFEWQDIFSFLDNPLDNWRSEYMRLKTYKKDGTFIEPVTILLGSEPGACTSTESRVEMLPLTAQFIPLRASLCIFLTQEGVMPLILNFLDSVKNETGVLTNYMNANAWKALDFSGKLVLPLFLYSDAFECGNCLGSHKTIHKINGMYVSMPFLPPQLSFRLQNIFLVYLHHTADERKLPQEKMYECLVEEFSYLYNEGLSVETSDFAGAVYFKLALFLGDNLGLHEMLGFVAGFTANFPCRICKVHREEMRQQSEDNLAIWRNPQNYALDIAANSKSETGVSHECIWNKIPGFHCTQSAGFDIMHDLLEGCCVFSLKVLIGQLLNEHFLDLNILNRRIQFFEYGLIDRDSKPPLLSIDKGEVIITMSAAEMLIFSKYFGLLIGEHVPEGNEAWNLYILLHKILDIVMSPLIPPAHLKLLSSYIKEHHRLYLELCKDHRLKNKMHHMVHYPKLILQFGPPVYFWSMRFEAKHRFPKSIAVSISNNRNLTLSIAIRAQLAFHSSLKNNSFIANQFDSGRAVRCQMSDVPGYNLIENNVPAGNLSVQMVPWAKVKGATYKKDMVLVTGYEDHLPIFVQIETVLLTTSESIAFLCRSISTVNFDSHYFAYEILPGENCCQYIELAKLPHDFPTVINTAAGKLFVTYKYGV